MTSEFVRSLFNTLEEGVLILAIEGDEVLRVEEFSPGRIRLDTKHVTRSEVVGLEFKDAFPEWLDHQLYGALRMLREGDERVSSRFSWESNKDQPHRYLGRAQRVGAQIILCVQEITERETDRSSLIAKAERLIEAESELEQARQEILHLKSQIHRMTDIDPLTGLLDRGHFNDQLKVELRKSDRYDNELALLLLSIDNLDEATEAHGGDANDQVMVAIAELLRSSCRLELDVPGRLGVQEFGIILPYTGLHAAASVATRIQRQIAHLDIWVGDALFPDDPDQNAVKVTVSAGLATSRTASVANADRLQTAQALINASTHALHSARRRGTNQLVWTKIDDAGDRRAS